MNNLRGLLGIKKMHKVPSARIKELYGLMKGEDERISGILQCLCHVERMGLLRGRMWGMCRWSLSRLATEEVG